MPNVGITIKLDMPQIFNKVQNDEFGLFLAQEWKRLIEPYTPYRDGHLAENVECKPFEIIYKSLYARYMYEGFVYVDPIYKKGGFTSDGGITFWSRPGIKKKQQIENLITARIHILRQRTIGTKWQSKPGKR